MLTTFMKLCGLSLLLLVHCGLNGWAVLALLHVWEEDDPAQSNALLKGFFAIGMGLMVDVALLFVLGLCGQLNNAGLLGLGAAVTSASSLLLLHRRNAGGADASIRWEPVSILILVTLFAVTVLAAMHAPGSWDDTMYHLPLARFYREHGIIAVHEFVRFPLFPQNLDLLFALGLMLGGDLGAQIFATLPLFIMAIGLLGASEWLTGSIVPGTLASATLYRLGPVKNTLGYAYVDNGLALFCWMAVLAVGIWAQAPREHRSRSWMIVAGIAAGGAIGTKTFGLVFVLILGVYLLLVQRDWKSTAWFGAAVIVAGSWWYLRSYIVSGDPVHPLGGNLFGYYLWDAGDLLTQKQEQALHGVPPGTLNLWAALKIAHVLPWVLAFATLGFSRLRSDLRCFQFVFLGYLAFWFFATQVDRYLAPVYAVGTLLSWYAVYLAYSRTIARWFFVQGRLRRAARWAPVVLLIAALVPQIIARYKKAVSAMQHWQASLDHRAGYQLFSRANQEIPRFGDRIVQLGFENAIYFFEGTAVGDWFGPGRYRSMVEEPDGANRVIAPERMRALMQGFGARMFAVSTTLYPAFDRVAYARCFDVLMVSNDGVLLALKSDRRSAAGPH